MPNAIIIVISLFLPSLCTALQRTTYLQADQTVTYAPNDKIPGHALNTYCYNGKPQSILRFFETVELRLAISNDDYSQYEGHTPAEVLQHYNDDRSLFSISLFAQKRPRLQLSPFENQCIGIATNQPYSVHLADVLIDIWRLIQLLLGISLFFSAKKLCNNSLFYYIAGVAVGICASFILLLAVMAKLFPRRPMMYGMLIGGWTIGVYVLKLLFDNLQLILVTYREYVFWYIFITGVASFLICYRIGPPTNQRSKNIIMWVLQLIACVLIYFSSRYEAATVSAILIVLSTYYFPRGLWYKAYGWYRRRFPKRRRLLTLEEYAIQGAEETNKSLCELRTFVNSPECKAWRVMSSLKDPARFANFANGEDHLQAEEIEQYERNQYERNRSGESTDFDRYDDSDDEDFSQIPSMERSPMPAGPPALQNRLQRNYINNEYYQNEDEMYEIDDDDDDDDDDFESAVSRRQPLLSNARGQSFSRLR